SAQQPGVVLGLRADYEESRFRVFILQFIKNFRSPLWIGTVVEGQCNLRLVGTTVLAEPIWHRQLFNALIVNVAGVVIQLQFAQAVGWASFNLQHLAISLKVDILARWHNPQFLDGIFIHRLIPYLPQGAIL